MSHEARINEALRTLGEEFRLGMVAGEEYRARRRKIVESWGERDATTSPGSSRSTQPGASPPPASVGAGRAVPAGRKPVGLYVAVAGGLLVGAAAIAFFARTSPEVAAPAVQVDPAVVALRQAADDFLVRNDWSVDGIAGFLAQWRALSPAARAQAADEPSLRSLRYRLGQNIRAESQLLAPDAPPEKRARLEMLEAFADELNGGAR